MPYQWTAEKERKMLLLAISAANLRPSTVIWQRVADRLGGGLTASAISQKYYKLRKDYDPQAGSPPTTPKKRKVSDDDDEEEKKPTPSKRAREARRDPMVDGVRFSEPTGSQEELKTEEVATNVWDSFESSHAQFTPDAFDAAAGMEDQIYGQFHGQSSGSSSFI
ncbi:hypothetical protein PV04_04050 [Phialophora macrospora]|uniref:Myb-like domain-containing protein n=1 Tax=Phialophora macrospora TaxID=1851006 RepID=A0A0D2E180_9EURO|nr:hypothetical protein PV04_04050 [Phialophora macrospora]